MGNERLLKLYLKYQCRCNELVWLGRAWTAPHKTATPHHITTASHPSSLCGKACVEAPRLTRRVQPEPEPNWPKVCVITSSIIIAKALPVVRCTLRTSLLRLPIRRQRRPSLPRLPNRCKNHHGYPPAQRAAHGPRGPIYTSAPGGCIRKKASWIEPG